MCVHNSPLADLRSLGSSVFDSWLLVLWLSSVLAAWRPPINWCVECGGGGDQTLAPPPAQGSTGGCDEDTGTTPPPSTQVAEERL